MRWASTVSTAPSLATAVHEASTALHVGLAGATPDLAVVFVSVHHAEAYERLPALLLPTLRARVLMGCTGGGVIGGGSEVERRPGLSLTAAVLPGVTVTPFHLEPHAVPAADAPAPEWEALLGVAAADAPHFVLLPDPFTFDAEAFLDGLDRAFPGGAKIGGLASGGEAPGAHALYLGERVYRGGLVGVGLAGDVAVDTIVAQGCRPIGEPMFVTRAERNVVLELDGRRPVEALREIAERADARDRRLLGDSLFLGIVMRAQEEYHQGDFLIRNLLALDGASGALTVGAALRPGAVVQFHLRDAATSAADLDALLGRRERAPRPVGSLLFSCLGRGMHLYGRPDHDTDAFRRHLGDVPLRGFFCNGEIGPVQGVTFLHGYTSAFGLFYPRSPA